MNKATAILTSIRSTLLKNSRNVLLIFLLSFLPAAVHADNDIIRQRALSGNVLSSPFEVNSRIIAITNGGFISTFSTDGYRKYERPLKNRPSTDYTVTKNGIILSVSSNRKTLSLYNPDGYFVWSYTFETTISHSPVAGYDGRVFVSTKDKLYCFGVTGGLRWERSVPAEITEQVRMLNDGTLLCISTPSGEKSFAYRFTPYGDMIEEITFYGEAVLTAEHENGVLILFSDGTFGCCSVQDNMAVSLWASLSIPNMRINKNNVDMASILRLGESYAVVLYPNGLIIAFNTEDGSEAYRTSVSSGFNKGSLYCGAGKIMVITEFDKEVVFSLFSMDGESLWDGMRKTKGEIIYFYTSDGYLLQFTDNWLLSVSKPLFYEKNTYSTVSQFVERPRTYGTYKNNEEEQYIQEIRDGFEEIMAELSPVSNPSIYTGIDPSLFEKDIISSLKCIQDAALTGYDFSNEIGELIKNSDNELYVKTALEYSIKNGYDPDAYMLKAIYTFINSPHKFIGSDSLYKLICDAVSSICKFTGAEIFQNYGNRILVKFMSSGYSTSVKEYAMSVMKSLMDLQI